MQMLFLCSTYMQLINAMQLKRTVFKSEYADIILNDHSRGSEAVAHRLEKLHLFNRVRWVNNKKIFFQQKYIEDIADVFSINFGNNQKFRNMLWDDIPDYDKIYFFNMDYLLLCVWDVMEKRGKKTQLVRFEEGIPSYPMLCEKGKTWRE